MIEWRSWKRLTLSIYLGAMLKDNYDVMGAVTQGEIMDAHGHLVGWMMIIEEVILSCSSAHNIIAQNKVSYVMPSVATETVISSNPLFRVHKQRPVICFENIDDTVMVYSHDEIWMITSKAIIDHVLWISRRWWDNTSWSMKRTCLWATICI